MKKRRIICLVTVLACVFGMLSGCGTAAGTAKGEHEAITIDAPYKNVDAFVELVHEKYPEINLEILPYSGQNTTAWMKSMLRAGELPDIYFTTMYTPNTDPVADKLMDLSGYDFTDNFVQARLREVTVDGAVYMLPLSYSCIGVTYNKTLLDANGWTLPTNLKEMEALKEQVEAAGYIFCVDKIQYPGYGFQYLCNILDTGFLSTTDGLRWQNAFLNGEANVSNTPKMLESMSLLQRWKDIGLLTTENASLSDTETANLYMEGNILFCVGNTDDLTKENGTESQFKLMPYLSEDGDRNVFILNVGRYVGLNKHLEEKGNEQKLQDALHIMELISTEEGMWALHDQRGSALLPLKDAQVEPTSYYSDVLEDLNNGHTAPFIYSGWDNLIVPVGNVMLDYIGGKATLQDVIDVIDENQENAGDASAYAYTTLTETLNTDDCAKLIGIAFAKAVGADAALISKNEYHTGDKEMNWDGVSGGLYALPVTENDIVTINPTGWHRNIETVTLTGKRLKELAQTGYDRLGDGNTYPYEFVTKSGTQLGDGKTYTVVICGATEAVQKEGDLQDSGVLGLDVLKDWFSQFETLSRKDIVWD